MHHFTIAQRESHLQSDRLTLLEYSIEKKSLLWEGREGFYVNALTLMHSAETHPCHFTAKRAPSKEGILKNFE
jgi:hypothetical protein